jgi:hypothetical protein
VTKKPNEHSYSLSPIFVIGLMVMFSSLAILFTWPLVLNLDSAIIGRPDFTDGPFFLWNLWWVKKSLLALQNPFWTDFVYYPARVNLSLHTLTLTTGLIYLPLSKYVSLILGLNLIQLASIVVSSLGMFQLVNYMAKPKSFLQCISAIIPSIIFGFSPFVFSHLLAGHYNLSMLWPIPYLILFLYKTIREDQVKNALLLGLFAVLTGYLDQQLLFFSVVLAIPIILFELIFDFKKIFKKEKQIYFLIAFGVFTIFFLLPYGLMMKESWGNRIDFGTFNNADIDLLFASNPLNPILHYPRLSLVMKIIGNYRENIIPVGFTSAALAILGLLFYKSYLKDKITYLFVVIIGFCLTMGPFFQRNGEVFTWIKLPYYYFQKLPFFNIGIVPTRFIVIIYFALAILSGLFLVSLSKFFEEKKLLFGFSVILLTIFSLIIIENYSGQMLMDNLPSPGYLKKISEEAGDFTILPYFTTPRDGYLQTEHQKKVLTGFLGRRIHDAYNKQYKGIFIFDKFLRNEGDLVPVFSSSPADILDTLNKYKVRYIIIDKPFQDLEKIEKLKKYLISIGLSLDYEDSEILSLKMKI